MTAPTQQIVGVRHLEDLPPDEVLVLTQDPSAEQLDWLRSNLPGTRLATLGASSAADVWSLPRSAPQAMLRLARTRMRAVIVAQPLRKLQVLACAMPAGHRFTLRGPYLEPLEPWRVGLQEVRVLDGKVTQGAAFDLWDRVRRRTQRAMRDHYLAERPGIGNDYGFLERATHDLPAGWPERTATVVIPVYNRRAILEKTLAGLLHQTYPRALFDVIIADDGSQDHPEALVEAFAGELRISVVAQEDLGFRAGRVRNLGMQAATGEVIVLLDCDMLPCPEHLEATMRWFHVTDRPLVVIGDRIFVDSEGITADQIRDSFDVVRSLEPQPAPIAVQDAQHPTRDWRITHYERYRGLEDHRSPYQFAASGNLAFFRRDALAVGGFDEAYTKWGGEDVEFGYRLYRRGAYFVPELKAAAYHQDHPEAAVRVEDRVFTRKMTVDRVPDRRKNEPGRRYLVPKAAVIITDDGETPIGPAVESVLEQSFVDFELLVATDRGLDLSSDPRVKAVPRAQPLLHTTAEFVLELHPADRLRPDAIGELVRALEADRAAGLACGDFTLGRGRIRRGSPHAGPRMARARDLFRQRADPPSDEPVSAAPGIVRRVARPLLDAGGTAERTARLEHDSTDPAENSSRWGRALRAGLRGDTRTAVGLLIDDQ